MVTRLGSNRLLWQAIDQFEYRTLPLLVLVFEVSEESEPEKPAESNEDRPKPAGDQFKVNGGEEGPNTNSSLEENILFETEH